MWRRVADAGRGIVFVPIHEFGPDPDRSLAARPRPNTFVTKGHLAARIAGTERGMSVPPDEDQIDAARGAGSTILPIDRLTEWYESISSYYGGS